MSSHPDHESLFTDADVIHSFSRAQAISDGLLVNVSDWASATTGFAGGFTVPVALAAVVWADVQSIPAHLEGVQDERGRAHDLLWMASLAARRNPKTSTLLFGLYMQVGRTRRQTYRLSIGPGDQGEAVITIMRPEAS
jgi:hypothetical protein